MPVRAPADLKDEAFRKTLGRFGRGHGMRRDLPVRPLADDEDGIVLFNMNQRPFADRKPMTAVHGESNELQLFA